MIKTVPFYVALLFFETIFWVFILKPELLKIFLRRFFGISRFLPDTFKQRALVQNLRKIKDDEH